MNKDAYHQLKIFLMSTFVVSVLVCCTGTKKGNQVPVKEEKGLKDYYKDYFLIGAAVTPRSLTGEDSSVIVRHFNSITAENAMKMGPIQPKEDEYL